MSLLDQVRALMALRAIPLRELSDLLGFSTAHLRATLAGKHDFGGSTLDALAAGLDAEWVLVPRERLLEVRQTMKGKGLGPDYSAPSAAELFMRILERRDSLS
jgi:hypothetical protein